MCGAMLTCFSTKCEVTSSDSTGQCSGPTEVQWQKGQVWMLISGDSVKTGIRMTDKQTNKEVP